MTLDQSFILEVEKHHFRTVSDTGANPEVMLIWNLVREHVGMVRLYLRDLPDYCETHKTYHVIRDGTAGFGSYGCARVAKLKGGDK